MKRKGVVLAALFILLMAPGVVFADLKDDFDKIVDFSLRMDNLAQRLSKDGGVAGLPDNLLILTGAVASVQFLGGEGENFVAALELVDGEWKGVEDVRMYKAYLIVYGPEFEARLPVKRSKERLPGEITLNSQILAVGKIVDVDTSGPTVMPIIECFYIREL